MVKIDKIFLTRKREITTAENINTDKHTQETERERQENISKSIYIFKRDILPFEIHNI